MKAPTDSTVSYHPKAEESARAGWYLRNRDEFVFRIVMDALGSRTDRVLDVGCGSGGLLYRLERHGVAAVGVDRDWKSLVWGRDRGRSRAILQTDACRLPFGDRCFDLALSSEMLEHVEDDKRALSELLRVSQRRAVFTVPAHMWLWTDSDRILMHYRRYSRRDVEKLVESVGGRLLRLHAFGMLPLAGILGHRILSRLGFRADANTEDLPLASRYALPPWIDRAVGAIFSAELSASRAGWMPLGHAWWAVVERGS